MSSLALSNDQSECNENRELLQRLTEDLKKYGRLENGFEKYVQNRVEAKRFDKLTLKDYVETGKEGAENVPLDTFDYVPLPWYRTYKNYLTNAKGSSKRSPKLSFVKLMSQTLERNKGGDSSNGGDGSSASQSQSSEYENRRASQGGDKERQEREFAANNVVRREYMNSFLKLARTGNAGQDRIEPNLEDYQRMMAIREWAKKEIRRAPYYQDVLTPMIHDKLSDAPPTPSSGPEGRSLSLLEEREAHDINGQSPWTYILDTYIQVRDNRTGVTQLVGLVEVLLDPHFFSTSSPYALPTEHLQELSDDLSGVQVELIGEEEEEEDEEQRGENTERRVYSYLQGLQRLLKNSALEAEGTNEAFSSALEWLPAEEERQQELNYGSEANNLVDRKITVTNLTTSSSYKPKPLSMSLSAFWKVDVDKDPSKPKAKVMSTTELDKGCVIHRGQLQQYLENGFVTLEDYVKGRVNEEYQPTTLALAAQASQNQGGSQSNYYYHHHGETVQQQQQQQRAAGASLSSNTAQVPSRGQQSMGDCFVEIMFKDGKTVKKVLKSQYDKLENKDDWVLMGVAIQVDENKPMPSSFWSGIKHFWKTRVNQGSLPEVGTFEDKEWDQFITLFEDVYTNLGSLTGRRFAGRKLTVDQKIAKLKDSERKFLFRGLVMMVVIPPSTLGDVQPGNFDFADELRRLDKTIDAYLYPEEQIVMASAIKYSGAKSVSHKKAAEFYRSATRDTRETLSGYITRKQLETVQSSYEKNRLLDSEFDGEGYRDEDLGLEKDNPYDFLRDDFWQGDDDDDEYDQDDKDGSSEEIEGVSEEEEEEKRRKIEEANKGISGVTTDIPSSSKETAGGSKPNEKSFLDSLKATHTSYFVDNKWPSLVLNPDDDFFVKFDKKEALDYWDSFVFVLDEPQIKSLWNSMKGNAAKDTEDKTLSATNVNNDTIDLFKVATSNSKDLDQLQRYVASYMSDVNRFGKGTWKGPNPLLITIDDSTELFD